MKRNYTKDEIKKALESTGYYPDDKTVNAIWVSILGNRPVVIEGFPGCGKTELSHALAEGMGFHCDASPHDWRRKGLPIL